MKPATRNEKLLACLLAVELIIPIAAVRFSWPLTTLMTVSSWGLINFVVWRHLCRQEKRVVQIAYLIVSAAMVSCLYGFFLIFIKPSIYLKVTETHFILNRLVLETAGSAILAIFFYTLLYRILCAAFLFAFVNVEKRIRAQGVNESKPDS